MANENQMNRGPAGVVNAPPRPAGLFNEELDLFALAHALLQRLWILILCFILGLSAAGMYTTTFVPTMYRSTATIYIFGSTSGGASTSDMQLGTQMVRDLEIISSSEVVLQQVISDLNLKMTTGQLKRLISVSNPSGSHMLQISAVSTDPHLAMEISNSLSERMREQIAEVMNTDKPSVVERATVAGAPYSPNVQRNALIGGLAGAGLAAALVVLSFMLDDTIKSKEDIQKYLDLQTLAELPYVKEIERSSAKRRKKYRAKKSGKDKTPSAISGPSAPES